MRAVFDIGISFGPNDIEHHIFTINDPDINTLGEAMEWAVACIMERSRKVNKNSILRAPDNVTSLAVLDPPLANPWDTVDTLGRAV